MIAERMARIDASGIRKVFDLAAKMDNPINLSIGQPDFDVPDEVKEAACKAIRDGHNRYTVTQGIAELRAAVTDRLRNDGRLPDTDDLDVMITSGTSGGLLLAMLALVEAGDEVMFADPYFVMYKHLVNLIEGVPIFVNTYPDFRLTAERVERHISPRTKLLILNSPCNPTGAVLDADTLGEIATLCNERGIRVITDEIYYSFCYDGPFASAFPLLEQGLLLDGFSKSHAMTGWRVGIAAGPRRVIQEMSKLQQYTFVCAPSMAQYAALAALEFDTAPLRDAYHRKRDLVCDGLSDLFEIAKPGGAFYAFPRAPGDDATAFVKKAIEHNVLIIPGNVFSERDSHFRISYAASDETIEQGIEVLRTLV